MRQTDAGLVIRGKIGMHTSPAYAEDVYIGAVNGADFDGLRATFVVAVNAPGVTVICRKPAAREATPPLSGRFDELDGQMWLDDVFVPWNRVFLTDPSPEAVAQLAVLAPALLLAVKSGVHPRAWRSPPRTPWGSPRTTRRSTTCST